MDTLSEHHRRYLAGSFGSTAETEIAAGKTTMSGRTMCHAYDAVMNAK